MVSERPSPWAAAIDRAKWRYIVAMSIAAWRWASVAVVLMACGGSEFSEATDAGGAPDSSISGSTGGAPGGSAGAAGAIGVGGASGSVGVGGAGVAGNAGAAGAAGATGGSGQAGGSGRGGSSGGSGGAGIGGRAGAGGTAGGGGASGAAGFSGSSGAGGMSGGGSGGLPGDGGACTPPCQFGLVCCGTTCVNPENDILNCGGCGNKCTGPAPFCNGTCVTPPCLGAACDAQGVCCGDQCCASGRLCCVVPGPGPSLGPTCTDPMGGTCLPGCPACRCASPDTPIATPEGAKPIASLRIGDSVYSVVHGRVAPVPIRRVIRVPAQNHVVVRLVMASGVVLEMSALHPTADGRTIGALQGGDHLDGVQVLTTSLVPYEHAFTYDILPDSDTGAYFAGGMLIGSTLGGAAVETCGRVTRPSSSEPPSR
jgi:hypothetical protein